MEDDDEYTEEDALNLTINEGMDQIWMSVFDCKQGLIDSGCIDNPFLLGVVVVNLDAGEAKLVLIDDTSEIEPVIKVDYLIDLKADAENEYNKALEEMRHAFNKGEKHDEYDDTI
tara:strand:+ start:1302 stop:1646 length:345 start_codon:yes stop_codon:yes gene_type:complete